MALEDDGSNHPQVEVEADFDDEDNENWSQSSVEQHFASVLLE